MTSSTIHRIIEQHAATRGDAVAMRDGERAITYRALNFAANTLARRLQVHGFRRGAHATVTMPPGRDLAVTLLAILKMGGSYTWREPALFSSEPAGLSFAVQAPADRDSAAARSRCDIESGFSRTTEAQYLHLDLSSALAEPVTCSPNLPIVARASDIACVLQGGDGSPAVLVPHVTITSLCARAESGPTGWGAAAGAFDLWMALMGGTTAVVESGAAAVAA